MKNFYNITKGQLITIWAFVIIFALFSGDTYSEPIQAVGLTLFFTAIFYTLGWSKEHKGKGISDLLKNGRDGKGEN